MKTRSYTTTSTYTTGGITHTLEVHYIHGERFATITHRRNAGWAQGGTVWLKDASEQMTVDLAALEDAIRGARD